MDSSLRMALILLGLLALAGCNNHQPPLAGGKPIAHWIQEAHDRNDNLRREAIAKLGNAGDADSSVLPALMAALKDKNPKVRCEAILAILKYGPDGAAAVETMVAMQSHDPDPRVREYAGKAARKLAPERRP
jgi:HEAT repeat protein